jgi:hypothetical protein
MFDENHDGQVTKVEFGNVIRALGENPSLKDIDDLFDKNAGGSEMALDTFLNSVGPKLAAKEFTTEQVVEMFRVFDKDGGAPLFSQQRKLTTTKTQTARFPRMRFAASWLACTASRSPSPKSRR